MSQAKPAIKTASKVKRASAKRNSNDLRPEYDHSRLRGGVRGKYYRKAPAGTNPALIEPELTDGSPDTQSVNGACLIFSDE